MTILGGLVFFILMMVVAFTPLFGLYYLVKYFFGLFFENKVFSKIDINYIELVLSSKFSYYQKLDSYHQKKFLKRIHLFINDKQFIGGGGHVVTEEMVVLISASAIQLTLGLDEYLLETFSKILIYPKEYYSKVSKQYHKGETNLGGAIVFSWKHFVEGYEKGDDKLNLGLHEMAHALKFDKFKNEDYDKFFNSYFHKWQQIASKEYQNVKNDQPSFFRGYAGTNFHEFFSVCVEHFFESPAEFKRIHPDIYRHLCILLNQDPLVVYTGNARIGLAENGQQPSFTLKGEPFHKTGKNLKHLLALAVAFAIWVLVVISNYQSMGITFDEIVFVILMLIAGYLISVRAFSHVVFYDNGILIDYTFTPIWDVPRQISYDQMISVEFFEKDVDELNDGLKITYHHNGKIKSRSYVDTFNRHSVMLLADMMVKKKVAVKLNTFIRYKD